MRMIRSDRRFRYSQLARKSAESAFGPMLIGAAEGDQDLSSKVAEVRFIRLVVATSLERTGRSRLQSSPPGLRFLGFDGVSRIAIPGQWCNRGRRSPCEITSIGTSCMSISASGWAIAGQNRLKLGSKAPDICTNIRWQICTRFL